MKQATSRTLGLRTLGLRTLGFRTLGFRTSGLHVSALAPRSARDAVSKTSIWLAILWLAMPIASVDFDGVFNGAFNGAFAATPQADVPRSKSQGTQKTGNGKPAKPRALAPTYDPSQAPAAPSETAPANAPTSAPTPTPATPPATPAPTKPTTVPTAKPEATPNATTVPKPNEQTARWEPHCSITAVFIETRSADSPPLESEAERAREQLGKLLYSRCEVNVDEAPMRDVLRALRRAIGINLVVFELGGGMPGIDPDQPVSLQLENASGLEVLEALAGMTGLNCTWQLNNATIEFGPKATLAREEARYPKLYETGDLAIDAPDYKAKGIGVIGVQSYNRRDSDEIIGELVRMIVSHCEPEAFRPAPPAMVEDANGNLVIVKHTTPTGNGTSPKANPNTTASQNFDPSAAVVFATGQWASIQAKDNNIIVHGPDFVHRTIDGYPKPIPPRAAEPTSGAPRSKSSPTP